MNKLRLIGELRMIFKFIYSNSFVLLEQKDSCHMNV